MTSLTELFIEQYHADKQQWEGNHSMYPQTPGNAAVGIDPLWQKQHPYPACFAVGQIGNYAAIGETRGEHNEGNYGAVFQNACL
jgi:hypothetical protein